MDTLARQEKTSLAQSWRVWRVFWLVVCGVVLFVACAPRYVRPYEPASMADSIAVRADSVAWAAGQRAHNADMTARAALVSVFLLLSLIILPATMR